MKIETLQDSPLVNDRVVRFGNWLFAKGSWVFLPEVKREFNLVERQHYIRGHEAKKLAKMAEEL